MKTEICRQFIFVRLRGNAVEWVSRVKMQDMAIGDTDKSELRKI
jgi:hypothetical protein